MKNLVLSLLVVLLVTTNAHAHTDAEISTNVLPEPLPESAGQLIYEEMGCPLCHGYQGAGDGFMSEGLDPKPRNFTDLKVMSRLNDMSMYHSIKNGIPGTAMPAWTLSDEQIFDVISYIKTFLADSQMTIAVCMNEHRKVDLRNLNMGRRYVLGVDQQEYLKVSSVGDSILVEPRDSKVHQYFKDTRSRLLRTHITVTDRNEEGHTALIAVRITDCVKFQ
jgi:hypothetical protein